MPHQSTIRQQTSTDRSGACTAPMTYNDPATFQEQREQAILAAGAGLLSVQGSLTMRILDIAKSADISVGTFYSHFESKEDLILALVAQATQLRRTRFARIFEMDELDDAAKLIVGIFSNYLFAIDHLGHFAAEELAANRAIWNAATEERKQALIQELDLLGSCYRNQVEAAIGSSCLTGWKDRPMQIRRLDEAAWFLMAGSTHVSKAKCLVQGKHLLERELPESLIAAINAVMIGFGWRSPNPTQDVHKFAQVALELNYSAV